MYKAPNVGRRLQRRCTCWRRLFVEKNLAKRWEAAGECVGWMWSPYHRRCWGIVPAWRRRYMHSQQFIPTKRMTPSQQIKGVTLIHRKYSDCGWWDGDTALFTGAAVLIFPMWSVCDYDTVFASTNALPGRKWLPRPADLQAHHQFMYLLLLP